MSLVTCFLGPLVGQVLASGWCSTRARMASSPIDLHQRAGRWQLKRSAMAMDTTARWFGYFGVLCLALGVAGAIHGAVA